MQVTGKGKMNIAQYLNRINYTGGLSPSLNVLKELHKSHLIHVPFENLDIHYGNEIHLDIDKIYQKIVVEKRGGFCYELNGLFHSLLCELGFDTKIISANVYNDKEQKFGKDFDHLAIIVTIAHQDYLVDVGFGEFIFHPLKLELDRIQVDEIGKFIFQKQENYDFVVSKVEGEVKSIQYVFRTEEKALIEFSEMCKYHQTSSLSHFTHKKLISKPTENGRVTITGNTLKITKDEVEIKNLQFDEDQFADFLMEWFQIDELSLKRSK
jgi:N-hydroxyarylamine O-acetyltransferase